MGCYNSSMDASHPQEIQKEVHIVVTEENKIKSAKGTTKTRNNSIAKSREEFDINKKFMVFESSTFLNFGIENLNKVTKLYIVCITAGTIRELDRKIKHGHDNDSRFQCREMRRWIVENQKKCLACVQGRRDNSADSHVTSDTTLNYGLYLNQQYPNRVLIVSDNTPYDSAPNQFTSELLLDSEELKKRVTFI